VTGLKAWHLRPSSTFYPKRNFQNAIQQIPYHADVIFCFCEIDCREGILMAVEKDRYETIEHGIKVNVDIYLNELLSVKKRRKITHLYVHPIPPVLDVTRNMVLKFNTILKKQVNKTNGELLWLNFEQELTEKNSSGNGKVLRKECELDGTHMSPYCII
jgi:hypothetical protein